MMKQKPGTIVNLSVGILIIKMTSTITEDHKESLESENYAPVTKTEHAPFVAV